MNYILKNGAGTIVTSIIGAIFILLSFGSLANAQEPSQISNLVKKETRKMNNAAGAFDVKTIPQKTDNKEAEEAKIGRMSLDKAFHGDLEAISKGEMIFT